MNVPTAPYAEEAVIARVLLEPKSIDYLIGSLSPEDFYDPRWRAAYTKMLALAQRDAAIDLATVQGPDCPMQDLQGLMMALPTANTGPMDEHAAIIKRDSFRRKVINNLARVSKMASESEDREDILAGLQSAVDSILRGAEEGKIISSSSAVDAYLPLLEARKAGRLRGLTWGIREVDRLVQPIQGGEMVVLAARPSVGKTAIAEIVSDHWSKEVDRPILFVSLEMSIDQLIDRAIARYGAIDAAKMLRGQLSELEQMNAQIVAESRRTMGIHYLDDPFATTSTVRAAAASMRLQHNGIGAIIIDYIQLLKDAGDGEVQRVTRISRNIKAIAREFDCPVLALSQLSRAVTAREDQHPKLHDLRESGAIEQDADMVIGLMRVLGESQMDWEVLKNRQGPLGMATLHFIPGRVTFVSGEIEQDEQREML